MNTHEQKGSEDESLIMKNGINFKRNSYHSISFPTKASYCWRILSAPPLKVLAHLKKISSNFYLNFPKFSEDIELLKVFCFFFCEEAFLEDECYVTLQ